MAAVQEEGDALLLNSDRSSSFLAANSLVPPRSVTALVLRIRALLVDWIQAEVDEDSLQGTGGLISDDVVKTFYQAGGDLADAVPFALLEARKTFQDDVNTGRQTSVNSIRSLVCEILARRIVAYIEAPSNAPLSEEQQRRARDSHHIALCKRFTLLDDDGDEMLPTSAMESASDQGWYVLCYTTFLPSHDTLQYSLPLES